MGALTSGLVPWGDRKAGAGVAQRSEDGSGRVGTTARGQVCLPPEPGDAGAAAHGGVSPKTPASSQNRSGSRSTPRDGRGRGPARERVRRWFQTLPLRALCWPLAAQAWTAAEAAAKYSPDARQAAPGHGPAFLTQEGRRPSATGVELGTTLGHRLCSSSNTSR